MWRHIANGMAKEKRQSRDGQRMYELLHIWYPLGLRLDFDGEYAPVACGSKNVPLDNVAPLAALFEPLEDCSENKVACKSSAVQCAVRMPARML